MRSVSFLFVVIALAGCDSAAGHATQVKADSASVVRADSIARARQDSINRAQPGYVIDSLLPVEEEIRRFRQAVGGSIATSLAAGSPSRDALIRRFARAVEQRDTADLRRMLVTAREYIDMIYPESPNTHPPYYHPPGFIWGQIQLINSRGLSRLLERKGGAALAMSGLNCTSPELQGRNTIWGRCVLNASGDRGTRLFGPIVVRNGVAKFLSYANDF